MFHFILVHLFYGRTKRLCPDPIVGLGARLAMLGAGCLKKFKFHHSTSALYSVKLCNFWLILKILPKPTPSHPTLGQIPQYCLSSYRKKARSLYFGFEVFLILFKFLQVVMEPMSRNEPFHPKISLSLKTKIP